MARTRRMGYAQMYGPRPGELRREVAASVHVSVHEQALRISRRQWSRLPVRVLMMVVIALCGLVLYAAALGGERGGAGRVAQGRVALRRLHSPRSAETGEPDPTVECIDGLSSEEVYERDSIGPFQVLTQKKYMLTIYGCAGHRDGEDLICLRDEYLWMLPVYLIGILYMFAGLAIICDEFFVPALELFTEELGLTPDVAGATFMAAGGSMPELCTSFIGTFNETDVGFAAIIGSAVFNVLFVIAVCTLASDEPLELTWWPLFRDVAWYLFALSLVAIVFKASSPDRIESWEALVLFLAYCGYGTFMKFNPVIEKFLMGTKVAPEDVEQTADESGSSQPQFTMPSTFRVGIFQLLTQNAYIAETAGIAAVTQIKGNLYETFRRFDKDEDGLLSEEEVVEMLNELGLSERSGSACEQLKMIEPRKGDGSITFEAFQKWYIASEARVAIEVHRVFSQFDTDCSGTIDRKEIGEMLRSLGHKITEDEVLCAIEEMNCIQLEVEKDVERGTTPANASTVSAEKPDVQICFDKFEKWYSQSMFWQELHKSHQNEANADALGFSIDMPQDASPTQLAWFCFTYPIAAMMYCTMPDVRREGSGSFRIAILEFVCALMWIQFFSLCLYDWLVTVSNTIGIPPEVSAVTILAGGTSIPDLLSSYVVARQGEGDMAVSSSIGSNIFDVLVGLPVPWLLFTLSKGQDVVVRSNSLFSSLLILIMMLCAVIGTVCAMRWKMTKGLGAVMMALYVVFIVQQMLQEYGFIDYGI